MHDVLDPAEMVSDELIQRRESGYDVAELEEVVRLAVESGSPEEMDAAYTRLEADVAPDGLAARGAVHARGDPEQPAVARATCRL